MKKETCVIDIITALGLFITWQKSEKGNLCNRYNYSSRFVYNMAKE